MLKALLALEVLFFLLPMITIFHDFINIKRLIFIGIIDYSISFMILLLSKTSIIHTRVYLLYFIIFLFVLNIFLYKVILRIYPYILAIISMANLVLFYCLSYTLQQLPFFRTATNHIWQFIALNMLALIVLVGLSQILIFLINRFISVQVLFKLHLTPINHFALIGIYFLLIFVNLAMIPIYRQIIFTVFTLLIGIALVLNSQIKAQRDRQIIESLGKLDQELSIANDELRRFRHDYRNILLSLSYFVNQTNSKELKNYFNQEVLPTSAELDHTIIPEQTLQFIENSYLKGYLIAKTQQAVEKGIHIQYIIIEPFEVKSIKPIELVRIIGILLDNASEAVEPTRDKLITVSFNDILGGQQIEIINDFNDTINKKIITKKGYTTKINHQGIGLANIDQLISPSVYVSYTLKNHHFTATVSLFEN